MLDDIESIVSEEVITIAGKTIKIKPLSFYEVMSFVKRLNKGKANLTQENFWQVIVDNLLDYLPELLASCCGITEKLLKKLPASFALELALAVIDVNVKSQEGLEKNLKKLLTTMTELAQKVMATSGDLASLPKS